MRVYLKFISGCLWLSFAGGLIFYIVMMINAISTNYRYSGGATIIFWVLGLIAIIIFGPATAILFGAVGNLVK